jgi:pimeloyl-ACP methyl ester carboxylesterase
MKRFLKKVYILMLLIAFSNALSSQYLISATYVNTTNPLGLSLATGLTLNYDIDMYKMVYNTVDALGQPTIASGAFLVPSNTTCTDFPVLVYHHGTSLRKIDVPSNDVDETNIGRVFGAGGYFVLMPDYIGMGDSPGLHPYCHAESEATATRDMIRAAREFIADSLQMIDNGELFLTGYSQGGHAAMAAHKYIEDNNLLGEFNVLGSAPCSGPYEMSGAMADTILSPFPYSNPGYLVYLLSSYQMVYGNLYTSYSDILNSPYDTIVPPYFDGNNTTLGMGSLNNLLSGYIDTLLVDTVIANFSGSMSTFGHPLWTNLLANDNHDWTPQRPIKMYYCTGDEQVTFQNAVVAEAAMLANGATDVEAVNMGTSNHNGCVLPALTTAYYWFDGLRNLCNSTGFNEFNTTVSPFAFPNPVKNLLFLNFEGEGFLKVTNIAGKQVHSQLINGNLELPTSNWSKGIYIVEIQNEHNRLIQRLVKQ